MHRQALVTAPNPDIWLQLLKLKFDCGSSNANGASRRILGPCPSPGHSMEFCEVGAVNSLDKVFLRIKTPCQSSFTPDSDTHCQDKHLRNAQISLLCVDQEGWQNAQAGI